MVSSGSDCSTSEIVMRAFVVSAIALFAFGTSQAAHAQESKGSSGGTTRYFTFDSGLMGDLTVDGILAETRQGSRTVSAKLDVCYPRATSTYSQDRFVVDLKVENGRLVGSGKSQVDGEQVAVSMVVKQAGKTSNFEGTIKVGSDQTKISSTDNTEQNEKEFREAQPEEIKIVAAPSEFTEVSPNTVGIRVKRGALLELIKRLKGQDALVDRAGLSEDCVVLRNGEHVVSVQVHPERAAMLIDKVQGMPGLVAVGYSTGTYSMASAVRVAAAPYRKDGKIDYDNLAAAVGAAVANALSATLKSTAWNATTGEFTLELTRADNIVTGADLVEVLRVKGLVGPEKAGQSENLIIWIGDTASETAENGAGPRLTFTSSDDAANDGDEGDDRTAQLATKIAESLKGSTWDVDGSAWKK
jgi:hypothetical protein